MIKFQVAIGIGSFEQGPWRFRSGMGRTACSWLASKQVAQRPAQVAQASLPVPVGLRHAGVRHSANEHPPA